MQEEGPQRRHAAGIAEPARIGLRRTSGQDSAMNTSSTPAHHLPTDQITVAAMTFVKPTYPAFSGLFCSPTAIDPPEVAKFIVVMREGALLLAGSIS